MLKVFQIEKSSLFCNTVLEDISDLTSIQKHYLGISFPENSQNQRFCDRFKNKIVLNNMSFF